MAQELNIFVEIAVQAPIFGLFTYSSTNEIQAGIRVTVPFGRRQLTGVVLGCKPKKETTYTVKPITRVIDPQPIFDETQINLGKWLASYYHHPLGEVFKTMLPASTQKNPLVYCRLTQKGREQVHDLESIFSKKPQYTKATVQKKLRAFPDLDFETLVKKKFLEVIQKKNVSERQAHFADPQDQAKPFTRQNPQPLKLSDEQAFAVQEIKMAIEHQKSTHFLLHGVTGSGKTEVYLRCIESLLEANPSGQILVMVPEISLTPQMTGRFSERFPERVSVVHSNMTGPSRWEELDKIRRGQSQILIGPRSAVFAAFHDLKLIIVDEEHDTSYKQTTGLKYHARDVSIYRANQLGIQTILGSATPALESYYNSLNHKYKRLQLTRRPVHFQLPQYEFFKADHVNQRVQSDVGDEQESQQLLDPRIIERIKLNVQDQLQCIIIVNRRGFAYFIKSKTTGDVIQCPKCSISLTVHRKTSELRCHYCDYRTHVQKVIKDFSPNDLISIGYGSERMEKYLHQQLPHARIARLDSDNAGVGNHLEKTLTQFKNRELDILVGTQMLAKGHDFPKVTLIVLSELEQMLNFADFRAGERTFQLVSQASGRAGRSSDPGMVLLQTSQTENKTVLAALGARFDEFATEELELRKKLGYPPYRRFSMVELKSKDQARLTAKCSIIHKWIDSLYANRVYDIEQLEILGPSTPTVDQLRGFHRQIISVFSSHTALSKHFFDHFKDKFAKIDPKIVISIDVDAQSLL